jgi:hypothetical protein
MPKLLSTLANPIIGPVSFGITAGKFEIRAAGRAFYPTDDQLKKRGKDTVFDVSREGLRCSEIIIPAAVMKLKNEELQAAQMRIKYPVYMEHEKGTIYFSTTEDGKILIMQGEKTDTAGRVEILYGNYAVNVSALELGHSHLAISADIVRRLGLGVAPDVKAIPAGTNELDGKTYFRFEPEIPPYLFEKYRRLFSYFGESGKLKGWLTCYPDDVLRLLKVDEVLTPGKKAVSTSI